MTEAILAVLLSFSPYFEDVEAPEARALRMRAVAEDIAEVALSRPVGWEPVLVAAVLIRIGREETHFARYVGEGRCREGRYKCDPDGDGNPQSLTYYQLKARACPRAHSLRDGSRAQHKAAVRCAIQRYQGAFYRCASGHVGAFSGYRSTSCSWPAATGRAHRLGLTLASMRKRINEGALPD